MGGFLWTLLGVLIWAAMAAPLASLFLAQPRDYAFLFATLHFHFFTFALLFGPMLVYALMRPLGFLLRFYISRGLKGFASLFFLLGLPAVAAGPIWYMETTGGPAPWEFNTATLEQPRAELADISGAPQSLIQIYASLREAELVIGEERRVSAECLILRAQVPVSQCTEAKGKLEDLMHNLLSDPANRSLTYYAYRAAFPVWTMVFLVGLMTVLFYGLAHRPLDKASRAQTSKRSLEFQLYHLVGFVFLVGLWYFMRFLYQMTTANIYTVGFVTSDYGNLRLAIFLWGFLILIAVGWLTIAFLRIRSEVGRWLVPSLATVITGAMGFAINSEFTQQTLLTFFGVRATWHSVSVLAIVLLFAMIAPVLGRIANLGSEDAPDDDQAPA